MPTWSKWGGLFDAARKSKPQGTLVGFARTSVAGHLSDSLALRSPQSKTALKADRAVAGIPLAAALVAAESAFAASVWHGFPLFPFSPVFLSCLTAPA